MQDQYRRLTWILVLGKPSARDHPDEGLAHYLLMTAKDSVRGMPTTRGCGQLHLLACEGLERDLLHANSVHAGSDALAAGSLRTSGWQIGGKSRVDRELLTASTQVRLRRMTTRRK